MTPCFRDSSVSFHWIFRTSTALLFLFAGVPHGVGFASAAGSPEEEGRFEFTRLQVGTAARIVVYAPGEGEARSAAEAAYGKKEELEALLSHFREDSEVSRLSREGNYARFRASPELVRVLSEALLVVRTLEGVRRFQPVAFHLDLPVH